MGTATFRNRPLWALKVDDFPPEESLITRVTQEAWGGNCDVVAVARV
jgi:hypothetical protein